MTLAIRIAQPGGPEVLQLTEVELPEPAAGEVRVRHAAIGINYIDVYHRSGAYPLAMPAGIGMEGAGVVEAVGPGVDDLAVGQRVAYAGQPPGAYAQARVMPARNLVPLPEAIGFETAAAMMLKGMTVQYLFHRTAQLQPGDWVLFHAAAGGVGLIAGQWARALGVNIIGTAGSDAKCELARAHGYTHCINYARDDFVAEVARLTGGAKCKVVYDSVGRDTFERSLDCLAPFGLLALFGAASGPVPPFDLGKLAAKGSLYVTRPTLFSHIARRADNLAIAGQLFDMVQQGKVTIPIGARYALADARRAHEDLEARRTTGSSLLLP
jgi:NADPH2:quinone reductase